MLNRNEALVLIKKYLKNRNSIRISLAVEAILKELAKKLYKNEELWGLTGLLHNIDYEFTLNDPEKRGIISAQILEGLLPKNGLNAIMANNYMHTGYTPTTSFDKALIATSAVSDFIFSVVAATPSKKLFEVDLNMVKCKFNNTGFIDKNIKNKIKLCIDFGMDLKSFLTLSLNTLKKISDDLLL